MDGIEARYQRCDGACELTLGRRAGRTALLDLYQSDPCRALTPAVDPGEAFTAVLLTTSGGLAGGDCVRLSVTMEADAAAVVTSQAAEKIYRSLGPESRVGVTIAAAAGTWVEWLPQGTILFDGARLVRRANLAVDPGARVLAGEIVVFGRTARGEAFESGLLHDSWFVRREGRLVWADVMRLEADIPTLLSHKGGFDGAVACATILYVADDAGERVETARALLDAATGRAGATVVNDVLVARLLNADTAALYRDVSRFWTGFRSACAGLPASLPRVWQC